MNGFGTLTPDGAVAVDGQTMSAKAVIICSGSEPRPLPGLEIDGERIVTSDQATNSTAETLPERVAVIGGGVIGAEFASVYTDFGVQTTLLEALPHGVLPIGPDRDTADVLAKALARRGTNIHRGSPRRERSRRPVTASSSRSRLRRARRRSRSTSCSSPSVAGRSPRGWVWTRPAWRCPTAGSSRSTPRRCRPPGPASTPSVTACPPRGSRTSPTPRRSSPSQSVLGENPAPVDYGKVPWVVYTHPEVAWVGMTEAEAREAGHDVEVHKHSFAGNGRAMIVGDTEGLVKVVAARGGPILGTAPGRAVGQRAAPRGVPGGQLGRVAV